MGRIFAPLREMGAEIRAANNGSTAPFTIVSKNLHGISYDLPVASAQVKSCILLAGLGANGITTVIERVPTRRHTEEMLLEAGASIEVIRFPDRSEIRVQKSEILPLNYDIPGDPSQAAFWLVAALITKDSQVTVQNVYLGNLRTDFLDVLERMGGNISITHLTANSADITASSSRLNATEIRPDEIAGLIDEIPILAVAAAHATGTTLISGASELRVKESDRISVTVEALRSFGVKVKEFPDGMAITGQADLHGGKVFAHLDHRIAMAALILGAAVPGTTEISGFETVESSYPGFLEDFSSLQPH